MTTYATGCSENGVLRFSCKVTDFARYNKENFIFSCRVLSLCTKTAKVSGSVVAGFPSPAEQYQEPPLDLNELLVRRPAATYFVRVEGDSMVGAGISEISPERSALCEAMSL